MLKEQYDQIAERYNSINEKKDLLAIISQSSSDRLSIHSN